MGIIRSIRCSTCGFTLIAASAGVAPYLKKPRGFFRKLFGLGEKKVFLQDPPAGNLSKDFGDKELPDLIKEKRVDHYAAHLCLSCLKIFDLDSSSEKKCKHCKSTSVKSVFEMVGEKCPKCIKGVILDQKIGITEIYNFPNTSIGFKRSQYGTYF